MPLIVATGTNGFIGSNVLEMLLELPESALPEPGPLHLMVSDLADSTSRDLHTRFARRANLDFVPHDELESRVRSSRQRPLAFIHNGACSSTEETRPEIFESLNLGYSKMVWRLCADLGTPLVYASSAGVYGDGSLGFSDKKGDCARYMPLSLYARSKHDFDLWALEQSHTPPSWFGLRYFNVYGAHEAHKGRQASMAYHLFHQIRKTGRVRLYRSTTPEYPDGGQVRDFVSVKDIVALTRELLQLSWSRLAHPSRHPLEGNGLFLNIGTGTPESWNALAEAVFSGLGLPAVIEYIDMPETLARQYQNYTCADLSSWKQTGISPRPTPMREGVVDYVRHHLERT